MKYFFARNANASDELLLLKWANDAAVRDNSFNTELISEVSHKSWFSKRIENHDNVAIYIIEDESQLPIGQTRFELEEEAGLGEFWKLDYSVAAEYRGNGLANCVLSVGLSEFFKIRPGKTVVAEVKKTNVRSINALKKIGFRLTANIKKDVWQYIFEGARIQKS